jgi:hypothetical protein
MAQQILEYPREHQQRMKPAFYATKPTGATIFWRTFLPWQMIRFAWINLKMLIIIHRSHQTRH